MYRTYRTPPGIPIKAYSIPGYGYDVLKDLTGLSGKEYDSLTGLTELVG